MQKIDSILKQELEQMCLAEAGRWFMHAATTPFLQQPLLVLFSEANLNTTAFEQVLDGGLRGYLIDTL